MGIMTPFLSYPMKNVKTRFLLYKENPAGNNAREENFDLALTRQPYSTAPRDVT